MTSANGFTYGSDGTNGNTNLTPTFSNNGTNGDGIFTFTIPLTLLGSPTSFTFQTTYLNGVDAYRSNEAFGNTITDADNPGNTGSLAQDTGTLVGINTFTVVPEPSTWMAAFIGGAVLGTCGLVRSRRQQAARMN